MIAHASATLPRSSARFASGSASLEHYCLGRDSGDGLFGSEGSIREVHCEYVQDLTSRSLSLIQRQPHASSAILAALKRRQCRQVARERS